MCLSKVNLYVEIHWYYFMLKKIFLASDHGGYKLKELVKVFLIKNNYTIEDLGCFSLDAVDYPIMQKFYQIN